MNKICCLFLNHKEDSYKEVFEKMSNSVDYIDFYNYNPDWDKIKDEYGHFLFKDRRHDENYVYSGNTVFALFYFKLFHDDYDYYFVCENDVLFTGDYKTLFDKLTKDIYNYDAILEKPITHRTGGWYWVEDKEDYNLLDGFNDKNYYNQLYTFYCFSNKTIDYIIDTYKMGYYGFHELVVSCALKKMGGNYDCIRNHFNFKNSIYQKDITKTDLNLYNTLLHPIKQ